MAKLCGQCTTESKFQQLKNENRPKIVKVMNESRVAVSFFLTHHDTIR